MEGYLVSGLPPGPGGVGRFVSRLLPEAREAGWEVLCRPQRPAVGLLPHLFRLFRFHRRLAKMRNARVVVVHPQSLRWEVFFRLASRNRVTLLVVDNSFFCIRSYNYRPGRWAECLDCLAGGDCHPSCTPFPVHYDRGRNLAWLERLRIVAPGMLFLVQNPQQGLLIRRHFGPGVHIRQVGMVTEEFVEKPRPGTGKGGFDVVFHGALIEAKGAGYAIALARHLPELSFLFPGKAEETRRLAGEEGVPDNVTSRGMTWESGLQEEVEGCKVVLCPSLWSAPVEGALVKSLLHNGRVAVFRTAHGYQADLPHGLVTLLDGDLVRSARSVRDLLAAQVNRDLIQRWIQDLLAGTDLASVFAFRD